MNRRDLLKKAVIGGAILSSCSNPPSQADNKAPAVHTRKKVRWRMASSFPRSLDTLYGGAEVIAEQVKKLSGGYFEIRAAPGGELVPALEVMDAVQQGSIQAGQTASYYYIGKNPALAFDCCTIRPHSAAAIRLAT